MNKPETIEFYGSLQSPYCYFALNRLENIRQELGVDIVIRPVLPGVIRQANSYKDRPLMEMNYFELDVRRTAEFLKLPYDDPNPSPVNWEEGSGWIAKPDQSRICRLYNMLYQAHQISKEYQLYIALMRLIWSGQTNKWDTPEQLATCLEQSGLPENLINQADELNPAASDYFAENQRTMNNSGHWGVPMFTWKGEPFYGQDRLDQLRWRIASSCT